MLLQGSDTLLLLCWLQIVKLLPFWVHKTPRQKKNVKYLVALDVRLNSWRPLIFRIHSASALRQSGCFKVHHAGHLPSQPLKSRVFLENPDQRSQWGKLSARLLLKSLIFTSSTFKLLCGIICSQGENWKTGENWKFQKQEKPFVVQQAKDLIFLGFLEYLGPG